MRGCYGCWCSSSESPCVAPRQRNSRDEGRECGYRMKVRWKNQVRRKERKIIYLLLHLLSWDIAVCFFQGQWDLGCHSEGDVSGSWSVCGPRFVITLNIWTGHWLWGSGTEAPKASYPWPVVVELRLINAHCQVRGEGKLSTGGQSGYRAHCDGFMSDCSKAWFSKKQKANKNLNFEMRFLEKKYQSFCLWKTEAKKKRFHN